MLKYVKGEILMNISKEIKVRLADKDEIVNKLREKSAILIGGGKETSVRYDNEQGFYEKQGKFIRLRSGLKNTISLKEKMADVEEDKILTRNGIEVEVDNIKGIKSILEKLGLKPMYTMEKYRLKWLYNKNEINLDELIFGCFLEIHGTEYEIWQILDELNLDDNDIVEGTYWDIFDEYKRYNQIYLNENDIKFPAGYAYRLAE
ncbi:MAG: CYTH domain-containing protein [Clostridiales bacterium]|nr:CYTH domain-containing protein [Clostridiales bacterium]